MIMQKCVLAASMLKQQSGQSGVAWAKACYGSSHPSIQKARLSYNRMLQEANKKKKNTDELAAHYQKSLTRAREIDANNRIVIPENVMLAAGDYEMEGDVPWYVRQRPFLVTNQWSQALNVDKATKGSSIKWWALNVEREVLSRQFDNSPSVQANLELAKKKYEWDSRIRYQDNVCGAKSADPKVRAAYVEMRKFDICERYPQELRNCQMKIKEAHQEYKEAVAHYAKANPLEGGDASSATTEEAARNAQ